MHQARAQLIPPANPLDAADRASIAPRDTDTLATALVRVLTQDVTAELKRDGGSSGGGSITGFGPEFDLRAASNAAQRRSQLHRRPEFLRLAAARLALCATPESALSTAARLRACIDMDAVVTFTGAGVATLTLDGSRSYEVNLTSGAVTAP